MQHVGGDRLYVWVLPVNFDIRSAWIFFWLKLLRSLYFARTQALPSRRTVCTNVQYCVHQRTVLWAPTHSTVCTNAQYCVHQRTVLWAPTYSTVCANVQYLHFHRSVGLTSPERVVDLVFSFNRFQSVIKLRIIPVARRLVVLTCCVSLSFTSPPQTQQQFLCIGKNSVISAYCTTNPPSLMTRSLCVARYQCQTEGQTGSSKLWNKILGVSVPCVSLSPSPIPSPPTLHYHNGEGLKLLGYSTTVTVPIACGLERQYKDKDLRHSDMSPVQKRGANSDEARVSSLEKPWRVVLHDVILIRASPWSVVAGILNRNTVFRIRTFVWELRWKFSCYSWNVKNRGLPSSRQASIRQTF